MKLIRSIVIRSFITIMAIVVGWAITHGLIIFYLKLFGPFYPGPDQQQQNAENYFISVFVSMLFFNLLGHWFYNRRKKNHKKHQSISTKT